VPCPPDPRNVAPFVATVEQGSTVLLDGHRAYQGKDGVASPGYAHLPRTQARFRLAGTKDVVPHANRATRRACLERWAGADRGLDVLNCNT
jgi:hypothetical protein